MYDRKVPSYIWALSLTSVCLLSVILYGSLNFYRDPGSIFYKPNLALERRYSNHREREANEFRNRFLTQQNGLYSGKSLVFGKAGKNPKISGVFMTVHRPSYQDSSPLELALSSALASATPHEREDLDLRVYFANTDPTQHPLWNSSLLDLADGLFAPSDILSETDLTVVTALEKSRKLMDKVRYDFAYALRHVYNTSSAPYIAIFEEDILFAKGWIARSLLALRDIEKITKRGNFQWSDMRLFNNESSIGFSSHDLFGNNVPIIILGVSAGLFLVFRIMSRYSRTGKQVFTWQFKLVICCITVPIFIILFFQSGKSSVLPPTPGVKIQNWGCCSQGMIMPRTVIPDLTAAFLKTWEQPDRTFKYFAHDNGFQRFVLDPIQVQHLGFQSHIDPTRTDRLWSMAFEDLTPHRLEHDHERMVRELYGNEKPR